MLRSGHSSSFCSETSIRLQRHRILVFARKFNLLSVTTASVHGNVLPHSLWIAWRYGLQIYTLDSIQILPIWAPCSKEGQLLLAAAWRRCLCKVLDINTYKSHAWPDRQRCETSASRHFSTSLITIGHCPFALPQSNQATSMTEPFQLFCK